MSSCTKASLVLGVILIVRLWCAYAFFQDAGGFFMLTGDDVLRTLDAYAWLKDISSFRFGIWLPLPYVITGSMLKIVPDLVLIPPLINTFFMLGALVSLYYLTINIFHRNQTIALGAVMMASFVPQFMWLSLSGLPDSLLYCFVLLGFLCWTSYLQGGVWALVPASAAFLFSTMIRYEGWLFTGVFCGFLLKDVLSLHQAGKRRRVIFLIACGAIAVSFIVLWSVYQRIFHRDFFYSFRVSREDIKGLLLSFRSGGNIVWENLLRYPRGIWDTDKIIVCMATVGMWFSLPRNRRVVQAAVFIGLVFLLSVISSLFFIGSRSYLLRPVFIHLLLLIPWASYGIYRSCSFIKSRRVTAVIFWSSIAIIICVYWKGCYAYNLYTGRQAIVCGQLLRDLWRSNILSRDDRVVLEERIGMERGTRHKTWECNSIVLYKPDGIFFDRKKQYTLKGDWVLQTENNPSILEMPFTDVQVFLKKNNYKIVVATSAATKEKLAMHMRSAFIIGDYELFVASKDIQLIERIRARGMAEITEQ